MFKHLLTDSIVSVLASGGRAEVHVGYRGPWVGREKRREELRSLL